MNWNQHDLWSSAIECLSVRNADLDLPFAFANCLTHNVIHSASIVRVYPADDMGISVKEDIMIHSAQKQQAETLSCTSQLSTRWGLSSDACSMLRGQNTQKEDFSLTSFPLYSSPLPLSVIPCMWMNVGWIQPKWDQVISEPANMSHDDTGWKWWLDEPPPTTSSSSAAAMAADSATAYAERQHRESSSAFAAETKETEARPMTAFAAGSSKQGGIRDLVAGHRTPPKTPVSWKAQTDDVQQGKPLPKMVIHAANWGASRTLRGPKRVEKATEELLRQPCHVQLILELMDPTIAAAMEQQGFHTHQVQANGPAVLWLASNWEVNYTSDKTFLGRNGRYGGQAVMVRLEPKARGLPSDAHVAACHLHNEPAKKKEEVSCYCS